MPLTLDRDLRDCLERANPYTEYRIEISEPDVSKVLRRQDEFLSTPPLVGAMVPANSLSASARGALIITPSTATLANFTGTGSSFDLNPEDQNRRYKGVSWTIDPAFSRATLKSIQAKVQRVAIVGFFFEQEFECQIYQITRTPGVKVQNVGTPQYQAVAFTDYAFAPLLNPAPVLKASAQSWDGSEIATLNFDLSNFGLILESIPGRAASPDQTGLLPKYLIVIRLVGRPLPGTGHFKWLTDNAASHVVSGVGTFDRVFWAKDSDEAQWTETLSADVPNVKIEYESYLASGQGVYLIDQGAVPKDASTGRIEFQRSLPSGTAATIEISTAGSGGPWTTVKHGDVVSVKQQTYHLRTTLTSNASQRATPEVLAQGIEFRTPQDVSIEGVPSLPVREIDLPWPKASIPEGRLKVVRTGHRDYLDIGSHLGSTAATSRLEADIFLASRHPSITRDKWFRLERMMVASRLPSATSEEFTLLSYASRLKRKIPQKVETLNSVHVVASSTTAQVVVNGASPLPGTTPTGNEYDGQNYYMRVRSTAATLIPVGYVAVIQGNTSTDKLDFTPALPQALVAGDVIEVHSGIFQTQAVTWNNADPADVWWDVLTTLLAIPPERIGVGSLPRGGKPPRVEDIAPGDATTQAKRKITGRLAEEVEGDKVLDIVSAIMGGVTLDIGGQMVFVQIIPLLDATGAVTVPLPPPAAVFDRRDFSTPPQTPLGLERRATVVTAKYGVPATSASPDSFPSKATTAVDSDALLWLEQQDLEDYGTAEVPDEISKWLYNTTDEGLYLGSVLGAQLVRVASTGLRVWPLSMAEKHPTLVAGDVIVISLDSYTDYDPSTQTQIKGPISVRGVLVRVGNEGRQLSMFVPGLRDNVTLVKGGAPGDLTGLGPTPAAPVLSASFDSTGQLIINSTGDFATASQKIAWATGAAPSAATVRAATPIAQQNVSGLATGSVYPAGTTVFIAAFAYSATGLESTPLAAVSVSREGAGTSDAPVMRIVPLNTELDNTVWDLRFEGDAGSGGGGANFTYDIRSKVGLDDETSLASGNATTLPRDLSVARHPRYDSAIRIVGLDVATGRKAVASTVVPAQRPEVNDTGNPKRNQPYDDAFYAIKASDTAGVSIDTTVGESGGKLVNRLFAKALAADVDSLDGVPEGTSFKRITVDAVSSGTIDFSKSGFTNKTTEYIPRTPGGAMVTDVVGKLTDVGHAASTMQESGGKVVNRLYAKALAADADNADSVGTGAVQRAIPLSVLRASDNALMSKVDYGATVGGINAQNLAKRHGIYFSEVFDETPATQGYESGGDEGTPFIHQNVGYGKVGTSVLRMDGYQWRIFPRKLPFNPSKLYRLRVRYRCITDNTVPGAGLVYIGLVASDSAGVETNLNGGYEYVAVASDAPTAAQDWKEVTTWVKGATKARSANSNGPSTDPTAPTPLGIETVQIKPMFAFNYPNGNGIYEIDYYQIEELDEDATDRTYTVIGTGQTFKTAAKESGTKPINRLLAKALAADPDTLDSTADGTTYKRIVSVSGGQATNASIADLAGGKLTAGTLVSGINESGGLAVNRLLAKALAADPNTLDSAPDGTVYKKITGVVSSLITSASSTSRFRCKVYSTVNQANVANLTEGAAVWDAELFDVGGLHDNTTNPSRITAPAGMTTGGALVFCQLKWTANTVGDRYLYLKKNGAVIGPNDVKPGNVLFGDAINSIFFIDSDLTSGDYFEVFFAQSSGGNLRPVGGESPAGTKSFFGIIHLW